MTLVITTFDWVPEISVGYVRDIRIRWACEEAGIPYHVESTSVRDKTLPFILRQPFGQVPMIDDGDISLFESGAILLYLGDRHEALMPRDPAQRAETQQWMVAGLNTLEPVIMAYFIATISDGNATAVSLLEPRLHERLRQLTPIIAKRDFIAAGRFTAADILIAEELRLVEHMDELAPHPVLADYLERMTTRPAFQRALSAQLAHYAEAA
ncbi:glutathione S-transferase family protein [Paracoccus aestuariivivens]|uniref:Glutathione S-transferase family protein n=1 Tax=Paracoccus aestuariivivens TaxID=1820333 RepID=A0A6L6J7Q4_9RHOB|nr:glutathione S-transferase family protein [Paracoccus aestuariivivens]MTH76657.1 glutathione S-transferase family protein [Paracoccus aestuariivivens]